MIVDFWKRKLAAAGQPAGVDRLHQLTTANELGQTIGRTASHMARNRRYGIKDIWEFLAQLQFQYGPRTVEDELIFTIRGFFFVFEARTQ